MFTAWVLTLNSSKVILSATIFNVFPLITCTLSENILSWSASQHFMYSSIHSFFPINLCCLLVSSSGHILEVCNWSSVSKAKVRIPKLCTVLANVAACKKTYVQKCDSRDTHFINMSWWPTAPPSLGCAAAVCLSLLCQMPRALQMFTEHVRQPPHGEGAGARAEDGEKRKACPPPNSLLPAQG